MGTSFHNKNKQRIVDILGHLVAFNVGMNKDKLLQVYVSSDEHGPTDGKYDHMVLYDVNKSLSCVNVNVVLNTCSY